MADQLDAKVYGYDELAAGTKALARRIGEAAPKALGKEAEKMAAATRMRVPRRSGQLAGSVLADTDSQGATVGIGDGVPYAGWIEFGGTRGRPYVDGGRYLFPTALAAEPLIVDAAAEVATEEIEGMRWPSPSPY